MAYVLNNIRFRSVSSKSIERYYESKSALLTILVDDNRQFSQVAREVMLLLFNSYSDWILKVESLLLNRSIVEESDLTIIFRRFEEVLESNQNIFDIHENVFVPGFMDVWTKVHAHIPDHFRTMVRRIVGKSQLEAYPIITKALVDSLHCTFFELYEVDCLLGSELVSSKSSTNASSVSSLVTYISDFDVDCYRTSGVFITKERIEYYLKHVVSPGTVLPVVVKNRTEEDLQLENGVVIGNPILSELLTDLMKNPRVNLIEI